LKKMSTGYKIIICGGGLSKDYQEMLRNLDNDHIRYIGFVDDIDEYTRSSDVVLNPVLKGGGVKTKVVEAIGLNKPVVSTTAGASGINHLVCGKKLFITDDENWDQFTDCAIEALQPTGETPQEFFDSYSWEGIAKNMYKILVSNRG
jgi:polysaccharide biosynthesis protein PslH